MKLFRWLSLAIVLTLLAGCGTGSGGGSIFSPSASPTALLPTPVVGVTHAPDAASALRTFLEALKGNDYSAMYAVLDQTSQAAIKQDDFVQRYRDALNTLSAASLDYQVGAAGLGPLSAQVPFQVTYHSTLAGDIARSMVAQFNLENGRWRLHWDDSLILPELAGGNRLMLDCKAPTRGDILDRAGSAMVSTTEAVALGVNTADVNLKQVLTLTTAIWRVTGTDPEALANKIVGSGPGWYIPVGTTSAAEGDSLLRSGLPGLVTNPYTSRYYANGGSASQVLGYTLSISPDNIDAFKRKGYCGDERVGYAGIELAEETALAGKHGGTLYIVSPQGQIVNQLTQVDPTPADTVYLTLDKNLQYWTEKALAGFTGAAVVMERDTGRVLAMASSPGFDSNLFDPQNYNNGYMLNELLNDPRRPLLNRATQGQYPLGSVFKVITFSAALESGLYEPQTTYDCQYDFTELPDRVLHDWTWDHCQTRLSEGLQCDTSDSKPSGLLTLSEGLMRSCDPYFWHIGLDLYRNNRAADIVNMAKAFGLDAPTGIEIAEDPGNITVPADEISATNQAIGQGDVLVTPLQVARLIAAIGNGGTLYRPDLVEKIVGPDGKTIQSFTPDPVGRLPLQPDRLTALQQAMISVIQNPRGTASYRLRGLNIPAAGKTGTAQTGNGLPPHAWFAGYTYANIPGVPDISVAVILENAGEGSDYAAPVFKRILETYFYGSPQSLYWWESSFGVTRTPTPLGGIPTKTPKPK